MKAVVAWLDRNATPRRVAVLLAIELLVLGAENLLVFPLSVPYFRLVTGRDYLDMCAFCSADQVYAHLDAFGAVGRRLQLLLFATVDVVIPTVSGLFGALGIALLTRSRRAAHPWLRGLVFVPIAAALLDFAENVLIAIVTILYPARLAPVAALAGLVSGTKAIAYVSTALTLIACALTRPRAVVA